MLGSRGGQSTGVGLPTKRLQILLLCGPLPPHPKHVLIKDSAVFLSTPEKWEMGFAREAAQDHLVHGKACILLDTIPGNL
jgi:hypothetical protein